MSDNLNKALRSLEYLLAETQKKISQIQNGEYGNDIVEDLDLKSYADYFSAIIVAFKGYFFSFTDEEIIAAEFKELSSIDISDELTRKPSNYFSLFSSFFDSSADFAKNKFNNKILERLKAIEARCTNLIYFLKVQM